MRRGACEVRIDAVRRPSGAKGIGPVEGISGIEVACAGCPGHVDAGLEQAAEDRLQYFTSIAERPVGAASGDLTRGQGGDEFLTDERHALTDDGARPDRRPPSDSEQDGVVGPIAQRRLQRFIDGIQRRSTGKRRHADLLRRRHVVDQLPMQVCEREPDIVRGQSFRRPGAIAVTHTRDPGAAADVPERTLAGDRRARASSPSADTREVPRAFLQADFELTTEDVLVSAWIGTGLKCLLIYDVAGEHGQRSRIVPAVDRMLQPRRGHTVDDDSNLTVRTAAHRELAAKIIPSNDSWHRVNGFEPVTGQDAAGGSQSTGADCCRGPTPIERLQVCAPHRDLVAVFGRVFCG